jgi:queuine/archaeosine tRNA-ribosyltransferase
MLDCVLPTRNGRHGLAYAFGPSLRMRHAGDDARSRGEPLSGRPRLLARLPHHLVQAREALAALLAL